MWVVIEKEPSGETLQFSMPEVLNSDMYGLSEGKLLLGRLTINIYNGTK